MYQLLSCGSNNGYQLGLNNSDDKDKLTAAYFDIDNRLTTTIPSKPIDIVFGSNHTLVLLSDGLVYVLGSNERNQLDMAVKGLVGDGLSNRRTLKIESVGLIREVNTGLLRLETENLESKWSENMGLIGLRVEKTGLLGLQTENIGLKPLDMKILGLINKDQVVLNTSEAITPNALGSNLISQELGLNNTPATDLPSQTDSKVLSSSKLYSSPSFYPVFTKVPGKFTSISAGWEFSILATSTSIYICGNGQKGELGLGPDIKNCKLTEVKLPIDEIEVVDDTKLTIISVKSCMNHTIVKTSKGFFGWGVSKGKLGLNEKILYYPKYLGQFDDYSVGKDFSVLIKGNEYKIWGKMDDPIIDEWKSIKSMWTSIHFQIEEKVIRSFGNNPFNQFYPDSDIIIDEFTLGSEHGLIRSCNKVYAWGWGEHGNCGIQTNENELNLIYDGKDVPVLVKGGLATSWVAIEKK